MSLGAPERPARPAKQPAKQVPSYVKQRAKSAKQPLGHEKVMVFYRPTVPETGCDFPLYNIHRMYLVFRGFFVGPMDL